MEPSQIPRRVRALFLSDLHLGCRLSRGASSLPLLKLIQTPSLYLVGDVVDVTRMSRQWYWPIEHQQVVERICQLASTGTQVHIVPGNHDECFRYPGYFSRQSSPNILRIEQICRPLMRMQTSETFDFTTLSGKRLLVLHGDLFDRISGDRGGITQIGSRIFDRFNWWLPDRLNHGIRGFFKWLLARPDRVEAAIIAEVRRAGYDGVVFGHLHRPQLRRVDGLVVANIGDWMENRSVLVETVEGRLELINAGRSVQQLD